SASSPRTDAAYQAGRGQDGSGSENKNPAAQGHVVGARRGRRGARSSEARFPVVAGCRPHRDPRRGVAALVFGNQAGRPVRAVIRTGAVSSLFETSRSPREGTRPTRFPRRSPYIVGPVPSPGGFSTGC